MAVSRCDGALMGGEEATEGAVFGVGITDEAQGEADQEGETSNGEDHSLSPSNKAHQGAGGIGRRGLLVGASGRGGRLPRVRGYPDGRDVS